MMKITMPSAYILLLSYVYYRKTINVETVSVLKWKVNNKYFPLNFIKQYKQGNIEKMYKDAWCVTLP